MTTKEKFFETRPDKSNAGVNLDICHERMHNGNFKAASGWLGDYFTTGIAKSEGILQTIRDICKEHGASLEIRGLEVKRGYLVPQDDFKLVIKPRRFAKIDHEYE